MKKNDIVIRVEEIEDYKEVENLVRESFWNVYRPGSYEHYLIHILRKDPSFIPELSFVMELNGKIIGQNVFFKAEIVSDDGKAIPIMTMGPIAIAPEHKRKGYGKVLLDYSLDKASEYAGAVCFEGNIDFYKNSGFTYAREYNIRYNGLSLDADTRFFLAKELKTGYLSGISGDYRTPSIYLVNEKDVELFDQAFPPKEKLKLPGQLFN